MTGIDAGLSQLILGVGVVIERDGQYLLGLRRSALGHGTWGFPGGHVEAGEDPLLCAARELAEETGMELSGACQAGWFSHADGERRYLTLYVQGRACGEPQLFEPTKCERWAWFSYNALPQTLFVPTAGYFALGVASQPMDPDTKRC